MVADKTIREQKDGLLHQAPIGGTIIPLNLAFMKIITYRKHISRSLGAKEKDLYLA